MGRSDYRLACHYYRLSARTHLFPDRVLLISWDMYALGRRAYVLKHQREAASPRDYWGPNWRDSKGYRFFHRGA